MREVTGTGAWLQGSHAPMRMPIKPSVLRARPPFIEHLQRLNLPLRLPRVVAAIPVETGIALVQEAVTGVPLAQ